MKIMMFRNKISLHSWSLYSMSSLIHSQRIKYQNNEVFRFYMNFLSFDLLYNLIYITSQYIKSSFKSMAMKDQNGGPFSLIKYEAEIEISENMEQYKKAKSNQKVLDPKPSPQDVLNSMIPPRDWMDQNNKTFMQYVSHSNASREDVQKLKQLLDEALQYRQARTQGICPIRQQLFSQAFDQIIRQVTINCPQRGLLLMRVRDEHKMTLAAYQTLYQSAVSFSMKKQVESQQGMDQLGNQLKQLQGNVKMLQNKKIELISKKQSLNKKNKQRKLIQEQRRQDEKKLIQLQAEQLRKFLQSIKTVDK